MSKMYQELGIFVREVNINKRLKVVTNLTNSGVTFLRLCRDELLQEVWLLYQ